MDRDRRAGRRLVPRCVVFERSLDYFNLFAYRAIPDADAMVHTKSRAQTQRNNDLQFCRYHLYRLHVAL